MTMKVLFVGSNPSYSASTLDPFCSSTMSGKILSRWLSLISIEGCTYLFCNVADYKKPNNRALSRKEIVDNLESLSKKIQLLSPDKIVALGNTAATALTLLQLPHYTMPHPSGLNRQLNDKRLVQEKINELRNFILCRT